MLILGGIGYVNGWVSLGQVTAATLYVQALVEPLDRLIRNVDRLQVGIASTSDLGIAAVPKDRERATSCLLATASLVGRICASRIAMIMMCCMASTWRRAPGSGWPLLAERLGQVNTGRLLSGIHKPRTGSITVGGVELSVAAGCAAD